jgi:hypothetical protein
MSGLLLRRRALLMAAAKEPEVERLYLLQDGVLQSAAGGGVSFVFDLVTAASRTSTKYTAGSGIILSMLGSSAGAWPAVRMTIWAPVNTDGRKIGIRLVNSGWPTSGSNNRGAFLDVTKTWPTKATATYPRFSAPDSNGSFERIWPISEIQNTGGGYQPGNNHLSYWIWGYGNTTTYQTLITDLWLE